MNHEKKVKRARSASVATNVYKHSKDHPDNQVEKALAETHEQVSDAYVEGTLDQVVEDKKM